MVPGFSEVILITIVTDNVLVVICNAVDEIFYGSKLGVVSYDDSILASEQNVPSYNVLDTYIYAS